MRRWLIAIGILLFVTWFAFALTPVDPLPNVVACTPERITPMVEVTVETPRANGIILERHALGCSLYYFEARWVGD
jgi:hypothetical protein